MGVTSDNSRGEDVDIDDIPSYTDIDLNLDDLPPENLHLPVDKLIVKAGTRKENPVRTVILFPGWIFGPGDGIQKVSAAIRAFVDILGMREHGEKDIVDWHIFM